MLEELSKHDKRWIYMALSICGDMDLARNLTQDMYIKIYESGKKYKEIKDGYVFRIIKNLYLHHLRDKKKQQIFYVYRLDSENIDWLIKQVNRETNEAEELLKDRKLINEAFKKLHHYDREILLHTSERSLRKNEDYLKLTVMVISNSRKNAMIKFKNIYKKLISA